VVEILLFLFFEVRGRDSKTAEKEEGWREREAVAEGVACL